jgi:dimethylglycine catabolism A
MWHPPEAIRYRLPLASWPTREQAQQARLFQPLQVGNLRLTSRTWVPAMVPWRATEEGIVTTDNIDWYRRFAQGRPGAIVVEATGIRDIPSGPLLRIGHDRFIPGLRDLVQAVKEASQGESQLFIQLIDFLAVKRRPEKEKYLTRFLAITPAHRERLVNYTDDTCWHTQPETIVRQWLCQASETALDQILSERELEALRAGYRERITDTELAHIRELPEVLPCTFAAAAERARQAGFDGVELHYAHAYTMASFLSAHNSRADGYGQTLAGRVRLPLEVYRAVRQQVGRDYTVGVRFLGEEVIAGGTSLDEACYFGVEFAQAGFDFLSISKGGKFEDAKQPKVGHAVYPYTGPSGYECMPTVNSDARGPFGRNVHLATQIKQAVNAAGYQTPVITAGGIGTFELAETILQQDRADVIAMARQALADPDWFIKVRQGYGQAIRRCEFTNYCEGLDQMHKQVTCKLWDRLQLDDPNSPRSIDGRRRLIAPNWPENPLI